MALIRLRREESKAGSLKRGTCHFRWSFSVWFKAACLLFEAVNVSWGKDEERRVDTIQFILGVKLSRFHTYKGKHIQTSTNQHFSPSEWVYTHQHQLLFFYGLQCSLSFKLVAFRRKFTLKHISHLDPVIFGRPVTFSNTKNQLWVRLCSRTPYSSTWKDIFTVDKDDWSSHSTLELPNHRNMICFGRIFTSS